MGHTATAARNAFKELLSVLTSIRGVGFAIQTYVHISAVHVRQHRTAVVTSSDHGPGKRQTLLGSHHTPVVDGGLAKVSAWVDDGPIDGQQAVGA